MVTILLFCEFNLIEFTNLNNFFKILEVSKNLLHRIEGTMSNLAGLFKKVGPGIVQYVSDLNDAITPYSLTPNGYLSNINETSKV